MKKSKFVFLIFFLITSIILSCSICLATDSNTDESQTSQIDTRNSDLYISDQDYEINSTINGNVYASLNTLNINPSENGGIIEGNLFVVANTVNIKSDVTYSDSDNSTITVNNSSKISGNVFVATNKFVLEPGCEIDGDLYICANEVYLEQNAKINGNVYLCANTFTLNAGIGGSLYASVNTFNMEYYGFISRDLLLTTENATLNGWVYRNTHITATNITTEDKFISQNNFVIEDADTFSFSGQIIGDAYVNAKSITLNNDNTCKISGNFEYTANHEIEIPDNVVSGEVSYGDYVSSNHNYIWDYVLGLITLLVSVYVVYLLISKFAPKYLDKISNISGLGLLKYLGIGLGFLVLVPIIILLLLLSDIGITLAYILLFIYLLLLISSELIFIITISKFVENKLKKNISCYLYILLISIILSLISLIPYVGFIISLLAILCGLGILIKNAFPNKNSNS